MSWWLTCWLTQLGLDASAVFKSLQQGDLHAAGLLVVLLHQPGLRAAVLVLLLHVAL
jgi:hypothetical protein